MSVPFLRRSLLLCLLALPLAAQQPAETLTIDYIEVPVTVVDRTGNPVRTLTKANFEVYDNKARVNVTSFETVDFSSKEGIKLASATPAARRSFLLLFDLGYSSPASLGRAQSAARAFVSSTVKAGDLVAVGTIDARRGYRLLSNFTTDRATTLASIANPGSFRAADPLQLTNDQGMKETEVGAYAASHRAEGASSVDSLNDIRHDVANAEQTAEENYSRGQIHAELDALAQLAASLRNLRGRKQILLLSDGFSSSLIAGHNARDKNQENEEADNIMTGAWYMDTKGNDTDRRYGSNASLTILQEMAQAFNGSDVMLHAIDTKGLRVQVDNVRGDTATTNDGLFLLARPTGGEVFQNSNDLPASFNRMLQQQEFVYVLGFQNTVKSPGKLHNLKVKLADAPSGARTTYRQAYFEAATQFTPVERTLNTADVITRDLTQSGVRVGVLAVPFPATGDKAAVPIVLEINGSDLLKSATGNDITAELFVYAFDEQGAVRDRIYDRLALDTAVSGAKLRANGVKYVATLSLPPGRYAVKTLVRLPGSDRMGYVRSDIDVPPAGQLAVLPPFVLDDPQSWLLVHGGRNTAAYPFHVNGEPFVPSITGHLADGMVRKVAVFVANAQPEELTWETKPPATLLAQVKGSDATKIILQMNPTTPPASSFAVTVHKANAVASASTTITP